MKSLEQIESERLVKLEKAEIELQELMIEWADPLNSHDVSENSSRDVLMAKITSKEKEIEKLRSMNKIAYIPGVWNVGDKIYVTYKRIVEYERDLEVPPNRILMQIDYSADVTEIPTDIPLDQIPVIPLAIDSPLGKTLLHKAHTKFRAATPNGYCEVEVERCLL